MTTDNRHTDNPLVSIIVPSYNHEKYIEEAILSIVNQTYKNIQLIVIDDGSTDGSRKILERLQKQYGFILVFQSNMGICKTLNKAIREYSTGKYIAGCASDDFLVLDRVEKQVQHMEKHPETSLLVGKVHMVDENSQIIENLQIIDPIIDPKESFRFESLIERNCIPTASIIHTREIWDKYGGYNENVSIEDLDFWLYIAYNSKIDYVNEYFAYYRWHGNNATTNTLKMCNAVWNIVCNWENKMEPALAKKVIARRASINFNILARKHKKESFKFLKYNSSYWDLFMCKNYLKGFFKLFFCWKDNSEWK